MFKRTRIKWSSNTINAFSHRIADAATVVVRYVRRSTFHLASRVCSSVSIYCFAFDFAHIIFSIFFLLRHISQYVCRFAFINQSANIRLNYDFFVVVCRSVGPSMFDNNISLHSILMNSFTWNLNPKERSEKTITRTSSIEIFFYLIIMKKIHNSLQKICRTHSKMIFFIRSLVALRREREIDVSQTIRNKWRRRKERQRKKSVCVFNSSLQ